MVEAEEAQAMESDGEEMINESVVIRSSSSTGSVDSDSEEVINFGIQPLVRTLEYFQELRGQHLSIPCHTWGVAAPDVFKCSVEEVRCCFSCEGGSRSCWLLPYFPCQSP